MPDQVDNEFTVALRRLETALESPVIPGEFDLWMQRVNAQATGAERLLRTLVVPEYMALFQEMERKDSELIPRVASLRDDLAQIDASAKAFVRTVATVAPQASDREHGEASVRQLAQHVTQEGLDWVIAMRKHALAVATWFTEAGLRDRGIQD
jgi:hypothetical protein